MPAYIRPKIAFMSLGGTIGMTHGLSGSGVVPKLTAADLIDQLPQLGKLCDLYASTFLNVPSPELSCHDLLALAREIKSLAVGDNVQGFVITQGTDTLEESAFFLDRYLGIKQPVILTGAMRNPARVGCDGQANILGAVQVAVSTKSRKLGVLVVFNDEIHAARHVKKSHSSNLAAFKSDPLGPIGYISEDKVFIEHGVIQTKSRVIPENFQNLSVPILTIGLGDDGSSLNDDFISACDGIVINAMGGGHLPSIVADKFGEISKTIPCVFTSRTGQGRTLKSTYGFKGSETDLIKMGLICSGGLNAVQARMLLIMILQDPDWSHMKIQAEFDKS